MPRPRLLVTRRLPQRVEDHFRAHYEVDLNADDVPIERAALVAAMTRYDAICPTITDRFDAEILATPGARVKILANFGAGHEHIDLEAAKRAGIAVTNTPDVLTDATADLAILLMLMATRRAGEGERELRSGKWGGWRPTHMIGQGLSGKTLGLVGYGRIARATAKRARDGFGMQIAYHGRREAADAEGAHYHPTLASLMAAADIVSLHVPGGAETRHMIDAAALAAAKPGQVIVNTARGSAIDEEALAAALAEGRIAAAGLDVYEREPAVHPALLALENAVLLPHLGSATIETRTAMGMRAAANLEAFFAGRELPDRVA
ncbi:MULTISPECIES: 2-hydroxyacid dehydrogenase [unclassified Sphingopyxis]|uniref:2-hydroxyacid dehydrogenase n=1 Tax=unclassified Sphingopyxis TaxID=2614943 RepID=UPI0007379BA1|nr:MULTISPECIES: D-glycerate dehydrogenase [unclassified Sphingopyxis]KTE43631.1 D-glycerate dehydrogenase [Sphingopyxis sp. HIX]KTE85262.1 D-glycerate dehydrogenase [Sphingopyxis sp. HXXIV]